MSNDNKVNNSHPFTPLIATQRPKESPAQQYESLARALTPRSAQELARLDEDAARENEQETPDPNDVADLAQEKAIAADREKLALNLCPTHGRSYLVCSCDLPPKLRDLNQMMEHMIKQERARTIEASLPEEDQETPDDQGPLLMLPCSESDLDEGIKIAMERAELKKEVERLRGENEALQQALDLARHGIAAVPGYPAGQGFFMVDEGKMEALVTLMGELAECLRKDGALSIPAVIFALAEICTHLPINNGGVK